MEPAGLDAREIWRWNRHRHDPICQRKAIGGDGCASHAGDRPGRRRQRQKSTQYKSCDGFGKYILRMELAPGELNDFYAATYATALSE